MKQALLIFLFALQSWVSFSQGHSTNFQKYWEYRERLTRDFMVVGDSPGMSMPAERWDTASHTLIWSDNTIWLGWYIGTLALEYHLLTNPYYTGFDNGNVNAIQETLDELYYALRGLIRLDENAESAFPLPCDSIPNVRNGFFLRDDVADSFYTHFSGVSSVSSDFNDLGIYNKEMSQDQVYHVLLGLALVKKFIPSSLVVQGMNLRQESITEALLILDWVHRDGWVIKNPVCQNKSVDRGPDAFLLSHGINEMVKFFSDGAVNYNSDVSVLYTSVWNTLTSPSNPGYSNVNNLHMVMAIAAIGTGWGANTFGTLMTLAVSNRWYAYPMLFMALHTDTTISGYTAHRDTFNYWAEIMLDEAPAGGPYTLYPDTVTHGYAVNNRFIRERAVHYVGNFFNVNCLFTGLDYMMLYNLYYVVSPWKWPSTATSNSRLQWDNGGIKIFPSPASGSLFLKNSLAQNKNCKVVFFNAEGREIYQAAITNSPFMEINIEKFPAGVYSILMMDEEGKTAVGRFVKN